MRTMFKRVIVALCLGLLMDKVSSQCTSGFYLSGMTCTACNSACSACTSASSCTGCRPNYYLSGGSCLACRTNCSACTSSTTCTACQTGYTLTGGYCLVPNSTTAISQMSTTTLIIYIAIAVGGLLCIALTMYFLCKRKKNAGATYLSNMNRSVDRSMDRSINTTLSPIRSELPRMPAAPVLPSIPVQPIYVPQPVYMTNNPFDVLPQAPAYAPTNMMGRNSFDYSPQPSYRERPVFVEDQGYNPPQPMEPQLLPPGFMAAQPRNNIF